MSLFVSVFVYSVLLCLFTSQCTQQRTVVVYTYRHINRDTEQQVHTISSLTQKKTNNLSTELRDKSSQTIRITGSDADSVTLFVTLVSATRIQWSATSGAQWRSSNEDRLRLLQFITGSSSIPLNGFQGLTSTHGQVQRFTIRLIYGEGLPESHTCFNRLDIPRYASYEELKSKLLYAIRNTQGFNIA